MKKNLFTSFMIMIILILGACSSGAGEEVDKEKESDLKNNESVVVDVNYQKEVMNYMEAYSINLTSLASGLNNIQSLIAEASINESLISDKSWIAELEFEFSKIKIMQGAFKNSFSPPEGFEKIHKDTLSSFDTFNDAGTLLVEGFSENNENKMLEGSLKLSEGSVQIEEVNKLIVEKTDEIAQ